MLLQRSTVDTAARFAPPSGAPAVPPMVRRLIDPTGSGPTPPAGPPNPPRPVHLNPTPPESSLSRLLAAAAEAVIRLLTWLTPTEHCPTCGAPADRYATLTACDEGGTLPWLLEYQCRVCERTWRRLLAPSGCDL